MRELERLVISIVGRPNVGKSTLFNKLVGRRQAIIQDQPGITRDRNEGCGRYQDRRFTVIDTGGLFPLGLEGEEGGNLSRSVAYQTDVAIAQSDVIFFMMDAREGIAPLDEEIHRILCKSGKPIYYLINKAEGRGIDRLAEFYRFGVNSLYPISSEHHEGISDLLDALYPRMEVIEQDAAPVEVPAVTVLGRPNVGKSTLINAILKEERLVTSAIPGTTRDTIDTYVTYRDRPYCFIDTAGIRRRGKISDGVEFYSVTRAKEALSRSKIALLLLDGEEGVTEQDTKIAGLIIDAGTGLIFLVNKSDLLDEAQRTKLIDQMAVRFPFVHDLQMEFISALKKEGVGRIFKRIDAVYQGIHTRVSTGDLNRFFEKVVEERSPPIYKGRPIRLRYITQAAVCPPTFVLFASAPKGIPDHYLRYIENQLRKSFNFTGATIRIKLRQREVRPQR